MSSRYDEFLWYQELVRRLKGAVCQADEGEVGPLVRIALESLGLTMSEALVLYPELKTLLNPAVATAPADE